MSEWIVQNFSAKPANRKKKRTSEREPEITVETGLNADAIRRIFLSCLLFQKHVGKCMDQVCSEGGLMLWEQAVMGQTNLYRG
jgi:hypothetical protein